MRSHATACERTARPHAERAWCWLAWSNVLEMMLRCSPSTSSHSWPNLGNEVNPVPQIIINRDLSLGVPPNNRWLMGIVYDWGVHIIIPSWPIPISWFGWDLSKKTGAQHVGSQNRSWRWLGRPGLVYSGRISAKKRVGIRMGWVDRIPATFENL